MHPRMRELIAERLAFLGARLPAGMGIEAFLRDEEEVRAEILRADAEAALAWGWLEGVADAEDVTVIELVEEASEPAH